ncbi:MAG: tRNA pseudouridine(55) synthase TruB [Cyclobacteriaceae bacterium]|nr:tRNA pseudouridine(55) synthase TruB [Cyclobacteriaceae bacterium]
MHFIPEEGLVLLIDKDYQWTSFDVIRKLRKILKIKKIGHAGTLDPLATGLLIVCCGKKTKEIQQFMALEKEYTGTMVLGKTTPSVDLETAFDSETDSSHLVPEDILNIIPQFTGMLQQVPPIYSAIKIAGSPVYKKARKGIEVEIEPRSVEAKVFEITEIDLPDIHFRLVCSKGFYVRSLVRDLGKALGVGAYLKTLVRTRIGEFRLEDAKTIDQLSSEIIV